MPPLRVPVPSVDVPSLNVTVSPLNRLVARLPALTVAVNVTVCPKPDGFVDDPQGSDRAAFERYARQLVTLLTTNSQTRPFDVLADKFNYFTAWVPSPQAGISTMSEQRTVAVDGPLALGAAAGTGAGGPRAACELVAAHRRAWPRGCPTQPTETPKRSGCGAVACSPRAA